jgi:UDP-N-acetylmuramate: L-alanyl-gamma-D-glutamyl-meso-diaminopimelate ligase
MIDLKPNSHIHLMGICGTAMASLAGLLKERGYRITGSDQNIYPPMSDLLQSLGIPVMQGYEAKNLDPAPDFVVVGNVISSHFPEAQALRERQIPFASLPETLRDYIIQDRHSVVVAGTHGKTTTTSMAAWVAQSLGMEPGFLIGGIAKNFSRSFQNPGGNYFVIEGDEYDSAYFAKKPKFLFYQPKSVILSSIEFDHADIYENLDAILSAFSQLLEIIPSQDGLLIYNQEDPNIGKILGHYNGAKASYGWNHGDWIISGLRRLHGGLEFDIIYKQKKEDTIFVPMFGDYNVLNALAVYALFKERGWQGDLIQAFASFAGVKRRQELIGEPNGIQVIEDFAHHPTAVKQTIDSFKMRESTGRLFAVFEPRSNTSRRAFFQKEYTEALAGADRVLISRPFVKAGADNRDLLDVNQIAQELGVEKAFVFDDVEQAIAQIQQEAQKGDTVLIMSNGGFQGIYGKLINALSI